VMSVVIPKIHFASEPRIRCCSASENGRLFLENNNPAGFVSASVDPKIDALNSGASPDLVGYEGLSAADRSPWPGAGALCQWCLSQEDCRTRTRDLQMCSDQCIPPKRFACIPPERSAVTYGGQPKVWTSPKRGPVERLERRTGCQPGLTIADYVAATNQGGRRDRSPALRGQALGDGA